MIDIAKVCERALALSKADDCIVIGGRSSTANIRWANNTSTTNGVTEGVSLTILSIKDGRLGLLNRNFFEEDQIEDLVRESEAACEDRPAADDYMPLLDGGSSSDWDEQAPETSIGVFGDFTPDLADLFGRARATGVNLYGYAEHLSATTWLATSAGTRLRNTFVRGSVDFTGKTSDLARSSWAGAFTKDFGDVDLEGLYAKVSQRLDWSKVTFEQAPGRYEVLLEPAAAADMAYYMYVMSARRDADEGRSVFSKVGGGNRIGEKLFADGVNLYSDPNEPGLEVAPFVATAVSTSYTSPFDAGMPVGRTDWVRDGVLENLITTRHWASKAGAVPAPFGGNLCFDASGPTLEQMIERTQRALLVTCFWYIRVVDPQTLLLTGLTRDGVFLVEDGEVKGAVNNFRYNMSPVQMFANTVEIGDSKRVMPREVDSALTRMPPLRVDGFNMSSVSDAT